MKHFIFCLKCNNTMGASSSKENQLTVVMQRGSKVVYENEINFWKAAQKSVTELLGDEIFESDRAKLQEYRSTIGIVSACKSTSCVSQGGVISRRRFIVSRGDYDIALSALRAYMSWVKVNYVRVNKLHKTTLNWMTMPEPSTFPA